MPRLCPDLASFLLHEDPLVRDSVGFHFFEAWSGQEELAGLVLQACRRYGEEETLNLLSFGCRFPLSAHELLEALRLLATSRPPFIERWVSAAPLALVKSRADLIHSVLSPRALVRLDRRASLARETTGELWRRLEAHSRRLDDRAAAGADWDEIEDLLEALARQSGREAVADRIRALDSVESLHFRWALLDLAGILRLHEVGGILIDLLESDEALARAASQSLARIGSPSLVSSVGHSYPNRSRRFQRFALSVLKSVKLESSDALLRGLLGIETDPAARGRVFDGLRFHFTSESAALLERELEAPSSSMPSDEIQKALYVFACIRGDPPSALERFRAAIASMKESGIAFQVPFAEPPVA